MFEGGNDALEGGNDVLEGGNDALEGGNDALVDSFCDVSGTNSCPVSNDEDDDDDVVPGMPVALISVNGSISAF